MSHLREAVSRLTVLFCSSHASPFALLLEKVLVNDKITALCQTNMPTKNFIKHYKQQKWILKNCQANKFSKTTIAFHFYLLDSLSTRVSLLYFALLFIPYLNVLSFYFYVSLSLNFDKFSDTAPLKESTGETSRLIIMLLYFVHAA